MLLSPGISLLDRRHCVSSAYTPSSRMSIPCLFSHSHQPFRWNCFSASLKKRKNTARVSKNLCPSAWGGDVSLSTAASPHKAWLLQLHAQGAIQSREVVSRDTAAPSCRHQRPRYKSDRGLEAAHSVGTVTRGQVAVWYWYLSVWFWPGSLAADTAAGERLGCLGLQLLPGDLSLS